VENVLRYVADPRVNIGSAGDVVEVGVIVAVSVGDTVGNAAVGNAVVGRTLVVGESVETGAAASVWATLVATSTAGSCVGWPMGKLHEVNSSINTNTAKIFFIILTSIFP
jgi:hypothetical protein